MRSLFPSTPLVLATLLMIGAACDGVGDRASTSPDLGEPFLLAVGESVAFEEADFVLAFEALVQDNRCPSDAVCITGGYAAVALKAWGRTARWVQVDTLAIGDILSDYATSAEVDDYTVTLRDVVPYPTLDAPSLTDPRAVLEVRPRGE